MDPVTPNTMFLDALIIGSSIQSYTYPAQIRFAKNYRSNRRRIDGPQTHWRRAGKPPHMHPLGFEDALHAAQILSDGGADDQVVEILPLRDLLLRHAET